MTSSPLFISVLESMVIFGPIDHVGWASASSTRTRPQLGSGAPPERPAARRDQQAGDLPVRAPPTTAGTGGPRSARCRRGPARRRASRAAAARPGPAAMRLSLLASASRLPWRSVASVTGRPANPTTALTTTSASSDQPGEVVDDRGVGQRRGDLGPPGGVTDGDVPRVELPGLGDERLDRGPDAEPDDLVARGLGPHDVERLGADRAGRAGDGDADRGARVFARSRSRPAHAVQGSSHSVT